MGIFGSHDRIIYVNSSSQAPEGIEEPRQQSRLGRIFAKREVKPEDKPWAYRQSLAEYHKSLHKRTRYY